VSSSRGTARSCSSAAAPGHRRPDGKAGERVLNPEEQVPSGGPLKRQVERFFEFGAPNAAVLADNYAWLSRPT